MNLESGKFEKNYFNGSVTEWFKVPVLKTGVGKPTVSSNLTASAINKRKLK